MSVVDSPREVSVITPKKGSTLADVPLCIAIDVKSALCVSRAITTMHLKLIPELINRCIISLADLPKGDHLLRALVCVRVIQYDPVREVQHGAVGSMGKTPCALGC